MYPIYTFQLALRYFIGVKASYRETGVYTRMTSVLGDGRYRKVAIIIIIIHADFTLNRAFDWHPCGVLVLNEWEIVKSFTWKVEPSSNGALQVSWQLTIQAYSAEVQEASCLSPQLEHSYNLMFSQIFRSK